MKRLLFTGLLIVAGFSGYAQSVTDDATIDERVREVDATTPAELSQRLTAPYHTDREKLRALFSWITQHIDYRVKNYRGIAATGPVIPEKDPAHWISADDFVAENVLRNRSAVCDGYARLFKSLCDYGGIRCRLISGFAQGDYNRRAAFRCNHTWNAVYLDSAWQLVDVTWASGYTNLRGDVFVRRYDENYFLAPPRAFLRDHFPDDLRWSLLENPEIPSGFRSMPYKCRAFSKYRVTAFMPETGIIEAAVGDTIRLVLSSTDPLLDQKMVPDTLSDSDSSIHPVSASVAYPERVDTSETSHLLQYRYCVTDANVCWLHIRYNHDTILHYYLKVKKPDTALKDKVAADLSPHFTPR